MFGRSTEASLLNGLGEGLPGLLGKRVQECVALGGIHGVDDGRDLRDRQRIEQYVRMEVQKARHERGRETRGQMAKQELLLCKWQSQHRGGRFVGILPAKHFDCVIPASLGDQIAEFWSGDGHKWRQ